MEIGGKKIHKEVEQTIQLRLVRSKITEEFFFELWEKIKASGSGEQVFI